MEKGHLAFLLTLVLVLLLSDTLNGENHNDTKRSQELVHSRQKRFAAFPEGSSFSVSICWTIGVIGNPNVNFLSFGLNWGVSYDLPNDTWAINYIYGIKNYIHDDTATVARRRDRRALYSELETIMNSMGYNGKDCIFRALCESKKILGERPRTMEEQLVQKIFSLPLLKFSFPEHKSTSEYEKAYHGNEGTECSSLYPACGFSLIALAFGKHSRPDMYMK